MKVKRNIIEINEELCDGCGQCVPACAEGALHIVEGKVKLISEIYCDGLGACLKDCPTGAIKIIEREAAEFDEKAVETYLEEKNRSEKSKDISMPCGCPSSQVKVFQPSCHESKHPGTSSALSHWPVQIRLVPPTAPFLDGADILVAAHCTPIAYPGFHKEFLKGRVVLIGCPKFDDAQEYIKRFAEIFRESDIRSVTVLDMEVPCCSALPAIVNKGMQISGKKIPIEEVVISMQGHILREHEYRP